MLDVQLVTLELEQRLNSLEENSNSSIGELEVRVGTLEAGGADNESRLTAVESEVEGHSLLEIIAKYDVLIKE